MKASARALAGVLLKDVPVYVAALRSGSGGWRGVRNRSESLEAAPDGSGYRCDWQWTSDLHAPKLLPALGRYLMRRALAEHPIAQAETPADLGDVDPQITFLIGHRGMTRLPHLQATLRSIAAQQGVNVECIVIEQDVHSQLAAHLPPWVRLIHTPPPEPDMPYCRAWTFNVGARQARGKVLVLHDNDMLVTKDYAAQILSKIALGYDVVNLKRFIFYLSQAHTDLLFKGAARLQDIQPEVVVQNLEGGGSVAITCDGYAEIGGLDESFVGWGGEDNEFWERAQTLRVWPWAGLPVVHLWHPAQIGKRDPNYHTAMYFGALLKVPVQDRIAKLNQCAHGLMSGPSGWPLKLSAKLS